MDSLKRWMRTGRKRRSEIKDEPIPATDIQLGDYKLQFKNGMWTLYNETPSEQRKRIRELERKVADLQRQVLDRETELKEANTQAAAAAAAGNQSGQRPSSSSSRGDEDRQQRALLQTENESLHKENRLLNWKVSVLTAMCAVMDSDYRSLCAEANVDYDDA